MEIINHVSDEELVYGNTKYFEISIIKKNTTQ